MNKIIEKITKKLNDNDIDIYGSNNYEQRDYILAENMILSIGEQDLVVSFHVKCDPGFSARTTLLLNQIKEIKEIQVGDVFVYDDDGKYHCGKDAIKLIEDHERKNIINTYMDEQMKRNFLTNAKCGNC